MLNKSNRGAHLGGLCTAHWERRCTAALPQKFNYVSLHRYQQISFRPSAELLALFYPVLTIVTEKR